MWTTTVLHAYDMNSHSIIERGQTTESGYSNTVWNNKSSNPLALIWTYLTVWNYRTNRLGMNLHIRIIRCNVAIRKGYCWSHEWTVWKMATWMNLQLTEPIYLDSDSYSNSMKSACTINWNANCYTTAQCKISTTQRSRRCICTSCNHAIGW